MHVLEKGRQAVGEQHRSVYKISGGKLAWYVKVGGSKKWTYDRLLTYEEQQEHAKTSKKQAKIQKIVENTAQRAEEIKKEQAAGEVKSEKLSVQEISAKPSQDILDKAPTKVRLYWSATTTAEQRALCDKTGVLCLDEESEAYIKGELARAFELSATKAKELKDTDHLNPLGARGDFLEDPMFMKEVASQLKSLKKKMLADQETGRSFQADHYGLSGDAGQARDDWDSGLEEISRTIEAFERYETDKSIMASIYKLSKESEGVNEISTLLDDTISTISPLVIANHSYYNPTAWDDILPEGQALLGMLGMDKAKYERRLDIDNRTLQEITERGNWKSLLMCALSPELTDLMEPWFEGAVSPADGAFIHGGANSGSANVIARFDKGSAAYWNFKDFKEGAEALRQNFPEQAKIVQLMLKRGKRPPVPSKSPWKIGSTDLDTFLQPDSEYNSGIQQYEQQSPVALNNSVKWGQVKDAVSGLLNESNFKAEVQKEIVHSGTAVYHPRFTSIKENLEKISSVAGTFSKRSLNETASFYTEKLNTLYDGLSGAMKVFVKKQDTTLWNPLSGDGGVNLRIGMRHPPMHGFVAYRKLSHSKRRGEFLARHTVVEEAGETKMMKYALKMSRMPFTRLQANQYGRVTSDPGVLAMRTKLGMSTASAIGANWLLRKMHLKEDLVPDWNWGRFHPQNKDNPIPVLGVRVTDYYSGLEKHFTKAQYDEAFKHLYQNSIAGQIGLLPQRLKSRKKGKTATALGLAPKICVRRSAKPLADWQKQIDGDTTHANRTLRVHGVYDIMYSDLENDYRNYESQKGNVEMRYHGTDFKAGAAIIKSGFRVFPSSKQKAGRGLGDGVYTAKSASKSAGYLHEKSYSGHSNDHGVLLWTKVSKGKVSPGQGGSSEMYDPQYDTILYDPTQGGKGWLYEEMCHRVPNRTIPSDGYVLESMLPTQWIDVSLA